MASTCATSPPSASPSTTTTRRTFAENRSVRRGHPPGSGGRPRSTDARSNSITTPVREMFLPDRAFHQGRCARSAAPGPVRRQLRVLRRGHTPTDLIKARIPAVSGAKPVLKTSGTTSSVCRTNARLPSCADGRAAPTPPATMAPADGSRQQDAGWLGAPEARTSSPTGTFARRTLFRLRDSGCAGQSASTSGWTHRSATSFSFSNLAPGKAASGDEYFETPTPPAPPRLYH